MRKRPSGKNYRVERASPRTGRKTDKRYIKKCMTSRVRAQLKIEIRSVLGSSSLSFCDISPKCPAMRV